MEMVPIKFDYKGKQYKGEFIKVSGGGSGALFHLMIDNYYCGQLQYTNDWHFTSNSKMFEDLSDFFGEYITAWYE